MFFLRWMVFLKLSRASRSGWQQPSCRSRRNSFRGTLLDKGSVFYENVRIEGYDSDGVGREEPRLAPGSFQFAPAAGEQPVGKASPPAHFAPRYCPNRNPDFSSAEEGSLIEATLSYARDYKD